jgi:hypothetical protein
MEKLYALMARNQSAEWDKRGVIATLIFVLILIVNMVVPIHWIVMTVPAVVMVLAVALSPTVNRLVNR